MLFELPPFWTVVLNLAAWLAIHLGVAWAGTRAQKRLFDPAHPLYRIRSWERKGHFYERTLGLRSWKDRLPDLGGRFRGGFFKRSLETSSPEYLERFILETCRGEAVHWAVFSLAIPFFLWNPWWAGLIMVFYAAAVNLPCILVQRYNRYRLTLLLGRITRARNLRGNSEQAARTGQ